MPESGSQLRKKHPSHTNDIHIHITHPTTLLPGLPPLYTMIWVSVPPRALFRKGFEGLPRESFIRRLRKKGVEGRRQPNDIVRALGGCGCLAEMWRLLEVTSHTTYARSSRGTKMSAVVFDTVVSLQKKLRGWPFAPMLPFFQNVLRSNPACLQEAGVGEYLSLLAAGGRPLLAASLLSAQTLRRAMLSERITEAHLIVMLTSPPEHTKGSPHKATLAKALIAKKIFINLQTSGSLWSASHKLLKELLICFKNGKQVGPRQFLVYAAECEAVVTFLEKKIVSRRVGVVRTAQQTNPFTTRQQRRMYSTDSKEGRLMQIIEHIATDLPCSVLEDTSLNVVHRAELTEKVLEAHIAWVSMCDVLIRDLPPDLDREARVHKLASKYGTVLGVRGFGRPEVEGFKQPDYCIVTMGTGLDAQAFLAGANGTDPFSARKIKLAICRQKKLRHKFSSRRTKIIKEHETLVWEVL